MALLSVAELRTCIRMTCSQMAPDLWSPVAEELLILTAAHESHLGLFTVQKGGPALGIYQMEPRTLADLYSNYLVYKPEIKKAVDFWLKNRAPKALPLDDLRDNVPYATAVARAQYLRFKEPLPETTDFDGLFQYYKKYWNTVQGKATYEKVRLDYEKYVLKA